MCVISLWDMLRVGNFKKHTNFIPADIFLVVVVNKNIQNSKKFVYRKERATGKVSMSYRSKRPRYLDTQLIAWKCRAKLKVYFVEFMAGKINSPFN